MGLNPIIPPPEGNWLAFEVSYDTISAAICRDTESKKKVFKASVQGKSESILKLIETLLQFADLDKSDLDALLISNGPTSFTALRISHAISKSLQIGLGIPAYGVSLLHAYAMLQKNCEFFFAESFYVLCEAYKNQIYIGRFQFIGEIPVLEGKIECMLPETLSQKITPQSILLCYVREHKIPNSNFFNAFKQFRERLSETNLATGILNYFLCLEKPKFADHPSEPYYNSRPEAILNYEKKNKIAEK